jgi:hypothetical protein
MKYMKHHIIMFLFFCITVIGMSGVVAWPNHIDNIGYFKLATNPWGIALYEDGLHQTIQFNGFGKERIDGKTIMLKRIGTGPTNIEFSRDDIIFNAKGDLYTESRSQEIETISSISGLRLQRLSGDSRTATASSLVYMVNPQITGGIAIQLPSGTNVQIRLDKKTIEFPDSNNNITVHVYDSLPTFRTSL